MKSYSLENKYQKDVDNLNEWFSNELQNVQMNSKKGFNVITLVLKKIRQTPGLSESLDFLNDIYNQELFPEYMNIIHIKPKITTKVWTSKVRSAPMVFGKDNLYDPALPTRKVLALMPLVPADNLLKIHWLSKSDSDSITGPEPVPADNFIFEESVFINDHCVVLDTSNMIVFDNSENSNHVCLLQMAFEQNPEFGEVVSTLKRI